MSLFHNFQNGVAAAKFSQVNLETNLNMSTTGGGPSATFRVAVCRTKFQNRTVGQTNICENDTLGWTNFCIKSAMS